MRKPDPKCVHDWLLEGTIGESWWYCRLCLGRENQQQRQRRLRAEEEDRL